MGLSVPDGQGQGVIALERPQGANGRGRSDSVPRTSACTDIAPLACTTRSAGRVSASVVGQGWRYGITPVTPVRWSSYSGFCGVLTALRTGSASLFCTLTLGIPARD